MNSQRMLVIALGTTLGALGASTPAAHAQPLPSPSALVRGLDLECYHTPGPDLNIDVNLTHLNPVLLALGLPPHKVTIRELAQTCVPVAKNNVLPLPGALPFIRHIDFACYRIEAAPLPNPLPINLTHLNPVLANLPPHNVTLERPVQLCVPMSKNDMPPPPEVVAFVQYVDLECYETDPMPHPMFMVGLRQLNPQLQQIPPHPMTLDWTRRQLCVPVRKNAQPIPLQVLNILRWIDLEKFPANPPVAIAPVPVILHHLNPLFANLPWVQVILQQANSLMVPVAKNGNFPPQE